MVEELAGVGEDVFAVCGEDRDEAPGGFAGASEGGFAGDACVLGRVHEGGAEAAEFVDEAEGEGLLACPDLSGGEGLDLVVGGVASGGDVVNELGVHVIDEGLEVGFFLWGEVAGGVSGVFELSGVDDDGFELGPAEEVAVVGPLHDDADGADDGGLVGVDLVAAGGDVISAGCADGLDGGDDFLVLFGADADDFVEDFLGGGGSSAGRVDVEDDGFDGGVVAELAELGVDGLRREDDTIDVDDADLAGGEGRAGGPGGGTHSEPGHEAHEEGNAEDRAANDGDIEPGGAARRGRRVRIGWARGREGGLVGRGRRRRLGGGELVRHGRSVAKAAKGS